MASRLTPLNKKQEFAQLLSLKSCATAKKLIMYRAKKDVKDAEGSLQVCAGQEAGSEAAINATYDIYQQDETKAVVLVNAGNAFNSINHKAMLLKVIFLLPVL